MTGITSKGEKRLVLVSGRAHPALAGSVAEALGTELVPTTAYDFANGEIYVRPTMSVRGTDCFVMQSTYHPVNAHLMELLIYIDCLKRASANRHRARCSRRRARASRSRCVARATSGPFRAARSDALASSPGYPHG